MADLRQTRRSVIIGAGALGACTPAPAPSTTSIGLGISYVLPNGGTCRLSTFKVADCVIDHIALQAGGQSSKVGDYYPASESPAFAQLNATDVLKDYQRAHGAATLALNNCSFFERYDPVTELSFPLKRAGVVITGGSIPYGPRSLPADPCYKNVILKALIWNENAIKIADYNQLTGKPLADVAFPDGLVTYRYQDHPLLVLTVTQGRMVEGAAVLKANGAIGDILTVDGGPSTHLWTRVTESVIATRSIALPHFLGFRLRA